MLFRFLPLLLFSAFSTPRSNSEVASFGLNSLQNSEEHGEDDRYGSHLEDEGK